MRCLAVCQDELVIRMLDEILLPGFEVEFIVENRPIARRLHDAGVTVTVGDPRRTDTYLKADISSGTCVIVEDNGSAILGRFSKQSATRAARWSTSSASAPRRPASAPTSSRRFPGRHLPVDVGAVRRPAADRIRPLADPARVQQYQRYFSDADRVLICCTTIPILTRWPAACAARRAAPHEDDGGHRRDPGRDPARKPADGQPARPDVETSRWSSSRSSTGSRWSTCSRTISAG